MLFQKTCTSSTLEQKSLACLITAWSHVWLIEALSEHLRQQSPIRSRGLQDLANQWGSSRHSRVAKPPKLQETQRSSSRQVSWSRIGSLKSFTLTRFLRNLIKACEDPLAWNHCYVNHHSRLGTKCSFSWESSFMQNGQFRTSCRSSTSPPQNSSSSSSSPALERSDGMAPRKWCKSTPKTQNKNKKEEWQSRFGRPLRNLPEWLEEFTDNLEDTELPASAHSSQGLRFGTSSESGLEIKETQYLYSLSKRPKLRRLLANQDDKVSLQKTQWRSRTSSRKTVVTW